MNGTSFVMARSLPTVSTAWQIVGADEFNGDGQVDILLQNIATGQRAIWLMNGSAYAASRSLPTVSTQWRIAGTGQFNGDGSTDLIWQNTVTSQRAIWLMNGTALASAAILPTLPLEWPKPLTRRKFWSGLTLDVSASTSAVPSRRR